MKIIKAVLTVSMLAVAFSAQATQYSISGSLTAWQHPGAISSYPAGVPSFTGMLSDSTGAYTFNFATFTHRVDIPDEAYFTSTVVGLKFTGANSGSVNKTRISRSCTGGSFLCGIGDFYAPGSSALGTLTYSVDGDTLVGTLITSETGCVGCYTYLSTYAFTGTAVPIPAAAWLFSSGLIGLASAARKRKVA